MGTIRMKIDRYVDLHCHILPGIDDGSPDLATSLALARAAVADGIGTILATPHHLDRHYVNSAGKVQVATAAFQEQLDDLKISLRVFAGQEVHLNGQLTADLGDVLGMDAQRRYVLLEFPHEMVPAYADEVIFQLACDGMTPVIAHPERNAELIAHPEKLYNLIERGSLAQVTATSLVGTFGKQVKRTAEEFVRCGLVQVVASDAHALKKRGFAMTAAYETLASMGESYVTQFQQNARDVINGKPVAVPELSLPRKQRRFWLF